MATTKTSTVTEARRRAREAKAVLDARRAEHDKHVEQVATDFDVAITTIDELRAQIDQVQDQADEAVRTLLSIGETADRVAQLTGLSTAEVRRIKKAGPADPASASAPNGEHSSG